MDSDPTIELSYDRAAVAYAMALYNELSGKPLDRLLLREFAERIQPGGLVCDAGCGPGQIAAELRSAGVDVFGVDISGAMVDAASKRNADIRFEQLDFVATVPGTGLAGIVSFYSIVHLNDESLKHVLKNFAAALGPNGWLLLAFHTGNGVKQVDALFGVPVQLEFRFFDVGQITMCLIEAGFTVVRVVQRAPYKDAEHPSQRAYILARRVAAGEPSQFVRPRDPDPFLLRLGRKVKSLLRGQK